MVDDFCPWEQQADEDARQWEAFVQFRDAGCQRTLMDCAKKLSLSRTSVTRWSKTYAWEARTRAWDAEVDRIRREKFLAEQRKLIRIHAQVGKEIRQKAMEAVRIISSEFLSMDPDKALRWIKFATELEQKSCGLPTEVTALALSGGRAKPTEDVYCEALGDAQLVELVQASMHALQKDTTPHAAADARPVTDGTPGDPSQGAGT